MARIRTIKPGFFTSEDVAQLSIRARLTWIGLWTYADDNGRGKDNTRLIKAALYPLDDITLRQVDEDMAELDAAGRIVRYEVDGSPYFEIVAWAEHQRIQRPTESKIPPPRILREPSVSPHGTLMEPSVSPPVRKGREGNGGGANRADARRPSPYCPKHPGGTDRPCRPCGDARRAADLWTGPPTPMPPTLAERMAELAALEDA